jgi:hypothetical protein
MRNKDLFVTKLEKFESEVKLVAYHFFRNEQDAGSTKVMELLERIQDMRTLLNTEQQD